jgi:hypothetical protein
MKIMALLLFSLLYTVRPFKNYIFAQSSNGPIEALQATPITPEDVLTTISAHQNKLIQLAKLNGFDLTRPDWIHEQVIICPVFSKHFFVRYQEPGERNADFITIYSRTGDGIYIILQGTDPDLISRFSSIRKSTISTFNAVLSDERGGLGLKTQVHDSDWINLARCYARLAGERPVAAPNNASPHRVDGLGQRDVESDLISSVAIEVLGKPSVTTTLFLKFSKQGFIKRVIRTESVDLSDTP